MSIQSINPATGELIRTYTEESPEQVRLKIEAGHSAWLSWRETSFETRAALLKRLADQLRKEEDGLALLMAAEMGKPLKDGRAEIGKCASVCEYYAENGASYLRDELIESDASKSYVSFQPLGIVLAIMPWNFPFWQVFRFLAPALMAGNCGIVKHSSNVPGCALAIESLLKTAGFPDSVFQVLMIGSDAVNEVIEHPQVKAVTLTGSTEAGRKVAAQAGSFLKKTVLELGGSDAYVILADADLESAAQICADARLINNGQSCIAAKRFIPVKEIEEEFTRLFKEKMMEKTFGDPVASNADLGPMASVKLRDELHEQVLANIEAGATCILGGDIQDLDGNHAYYQPTILTGVKENMPAYSEEMFGPVAAIISAMDTEDAIWIANDTSFGLGAAVFTSDNSLGEEIARTKLQAGCCFVNAQVRSDPRLPFGGINESGYGRELGVYGIREFVNIKTVYVA